MHVGREGVLFSELSPAFPAEKKRNEKNLEGRVGMDGEGGTGESKRRVHTALMI